MTTGLAFLHALYQCRELSAAVVRFGGQKTLSNIERSIGGGLAAVQECLGARHYPDIDSEIAHIAELVLQDIENADYEFSLAPCELGSQVLAKLQEAVFGKASLPTCFMRCVHQASLSEAEQARDLCVAALLDTLSMHNALSLLSLARSAGCAPLRRAARRLATSHFSLVTAHDYAGLVTLPANEMVSLLADDAVSVTSEAEVFRALAAWVEADAGPRAPGLLAHVCATVRLPRMGPEDLAYLESHPLVLADRKLLMVVANAFLSRLMGTPLGEPFGLRFEHRPRTGGKQHHKRRGSTKRHNAGAGGRGMPSGSNADIDDAAVERTTAARPTPWGISDDSMITLESESSMSGFNGGARLGFHVDDHPAVSSLDGALQSSGIGALPPSLQLSSCPNYAGVTAPMELAMASEERGPLHPRARQYASCWDLGFVSSSDEDSEGSGSELSRTPSAASMRLSPTGSAGGRGAESVGPCSAGSPSRAPWSARSPSFSSAVAVRRAAPPSTSVFECALRRMGRGALVPRSEGLREAMAAAVGLDVPSPARPLRDAAARGDGHPAARVNRVRRGTGDGSDAPRPSRRALFAAKLAPPEAALDGAAAAGNAGGSASETVLDGTLPCSSSGDKLISPRTSGLLCATLGEGSRAVVRAGGLTGVEMLLSPTRRVGECALGSGLALPGQQPVAPAAAAAGNAGFPAGPSRRRIVY